MDNLKQNYFLSFFLFLTIFFLNSYQLSFQHWSAIIDNDIAYIFDTILVS